LRPARRASISRARPSCRPWSARTSIPGSRKGLSYAADNYTRENIANDLNLALYYGVAVVMSQGIEKGEGGIPGPR
jgi:hypothetical protein